MTRADRTAAAAAQQSTFELLCWSFWDIVGEQILNIYLVNIHCFLTQECYHKKYMCRRAGPGRYRVYSKIDSFSCRKTDFSSNICLYRFSQYTYNRCNFLERWRYMENYWRWLAFVFIWNTTILFTIFDILGCVTYLENYPTHGMLFLLHNQKQDSLKHK